MSTGPKKNARLAPLADAYEPSEADLERLLTKIQTSIGESPRSSVASAGAWYGRKGLLVGLSCAVVAVIGAVAFTTDRARTPAATTTTTTTVSTVTLPKVERAASIGVDALPNAEEAPTKDTPVPMPSATAVASAPAMKLPVKPVASSAPSEDTLAAEARMLAEAVRVHQSGEPGRALALLEEHARTFRNGWLGDERAAERVVVLCSLGRHEDATREAKAFLAGRPKSPLTRRVEMSCGRQQEP